MPHTYVKKGNREVLPQNLVEEAINEVKSGKGIRPTARKYGIPKSTLLRLSKDNIFKKSDYSTKYSSKQVFSKTQESMLSNYYIQSSKLHYGLNRKAALKLAYSFAKCNKIEYPKAWDKSESASRDWLRGFYTRNPIISLRKPEATSLSRSTSFNKTNVDQFYKHLKTIMEEKLIRPDDIWNIDETGLTTVHKPKKVLTEKGCKQVGQMTSAERGSLVTVCCSINAIGQSIPPFYIFPRVNFRKIMLKGGPIGCMGAAHPSGWMTGENFLIFFKHFLQYAKPSKDRHILVIFDNHDSHIQIDLINLARENNVILLTLPPHTSHKLQPLDVSVYGPFKSYFNAAAESLMLRQPGKPIQIYDIPELSNEAMGKAFTPSNISSGFKRTGIYPFNENTFTDVDFLGSYVTDREMPSSSTNAIDREVPSSSNSITDSAMPSTIDSQSPDDTEMALGKDDYSQIQNFNIISPEIILPFPKAAPRIKKSIGRKPAKTRIITETPEKNEIEEQQLARKRKKELKAKKGTIRKLTLGLGRERKASESSSEDENINEKDLCQDSSSGLESFSDEELDFPKLNTKDKKYCTAEYILVKLQVEGKKEMFVHYIGKVLDATSSPDRIKISYLRKSSKNNEFYFPNKEDIDEISVERVVGKLSEPISKGSSKRISKYLHFRENLNDFYNLR